MKYLWMHFRIRFKRLVRHYITRDWWVVRKCNFPYDAGYGTYNISKKTVLDTGLTKEHATMICKELNAWWRK